MSKEIEKRLEKHWKVYNDAVDTIALQTFNDQVKSYLRKNNLHFLAGNGTYFIYEMINNVPVDRDSEDLPKWLYDVLEQEIPGMSGNSLGTIMPDYHPE